MQLESLKNAALNRISKIVDEVFENSEVYREQIDKAKFMEHLSDRIENGLAPEKAISVADDRLTRHSQTTIWQSNYWGICQMA